MIKRSFLVAAAVCGTAVVGLPALPAHAAAKAGGSCKKLGEVSGTLTCTKKGTKRVWAESAAPTTVAASSGGAATTVAAAPAGLAKVPGFDGTSITVGYLGNVSVNDQFPASRSFSDGGKALTAGYNAVIDRVNAAGGIAGKYKIKTLFKETYYTPSEAVKAYAEIKNQVVMVGQVYGTPQSQVLSKSLAEDNLIGSPISLDAAWVRDPSMLPVGSTYQGQAINLLEWAVKEGGQAGKTFCSLALANNAYGDAGEEGFKFGAAKLGLKVGTVIKTSTAPAQAQALKDAKCDAVVITISGEAQTPPLLSETAKLDYFPLFLALGPSFASRSVVPANSAQFAKQVIVAVDNFQWGDESNAAMKQHMADLRKNAPEQIGNPNPATVWGAAQAQTVVALLEKAVAGNDLSKDGMKKAMAGLGTVDLGGMFPSWNYTDPAKRVAPEPNYICNVDIATRGGLKQIKEWKSAVVADFFKK